MRHTRHAACAALLAGVLVLGPQPVAAAPRDGAEVYRTVCAQCHAAGQAGAPKLGDRKAWAPLIREGQSALTGVAYVGIRGMPPKGGAPGLSVEDFARATVYMANEGGARWKDPDAAMLGRIEGVVARQLARKPRSAAPG
jgi:cytochrome c5